jgi:hypothetical protein
MPHHPHVIAPHSKHAMTQHVVPSDCCPNDQLCTAPPQYLGAVIVCCLFSTLLYPGDIRGLVCVGALVVSDKSTDIISKVGHVGAIMTYH